MFALDLFNTKYEKNLREGAVDKVVTEGGPYDLPGKDYDRPGDSLRRPRPQGDTSPRRHPDDPDFMDPDQRRLRADQARVRKANAEYYAKKNPGVAESTGQDSKSWMASIRQQHPDVRFVQAKMPGAPIMALVNGKPVAQWDGKVDVEESTVNEFAPSAGGGSGDYFQALASAWYNGAFDTGSLQKGIKSKEDVERLLNRGIIGPDGVTRKYAIDYNSTFDGVVISSDDYYEHADHDETDSRTGKPFGPYDYMEFGDEELDESAKWRDPKYKDQLYTQEPPDYNNTREYDNARFNPKPKGYPGRKKLPGGGEYDRTDPLVKGAGIGRSGIKHNINLSGKRKGLPSRDQITSLKQSIKDISGRHTRANLPEQGEVTKTATGLKHRATDKYGAGNDEPHYYTGGRSGFSDPGKYARDLEHVNKQLVKDLDASMGISWKNRGTKGVEVDEQGVAEGGSRYDDNRTGFGKRSREDDEYHVPDPVETQYNIKVNGQVINRQPFANRAAAVAWAKQAVASGKLDPKTATLSPINQVNELSTDKLAQYKKAAGADATAADKQGDYERGNKRFKGIVKATIKQGDNDAKKHKPTNEESNTASDAVERAVLNRIMVAHTDLLMQFGPEKVMQAAEEVAYNVGDVDEIGTSDVSAYVNQVRQILGA